MKALDTWELRALERDNPGLEQSHVKDAYDQGGLLAAARVAKRFQGYENLRWEETRGFDPAEPERAQFVTYPFRFDARRLRDMIDQGFPLYRSTEGSDFQETAVELLEVYSDDLRWEWRCLVEVEKTGTWDARKRKHDVARRYKRIRVKKDPCYAVDGEKLEKRKVRAFDDRTGTWYHQWECWVWRWRAVDEYDEIGATQVRDKVLRFCIKEDQDPNAFMQDAAEPIEKDGLGRRYSID